MNLSTGKASPDACIADLASWGVRVAWHEAVALVHHVGSRAIIDPESVGVPHVDRTYLTIDGYVQLRPSPASGPIVPALAEMLARLLEGDAPPDLQTLGRAELPEVRDLGPQEFLSALTVFARPDEHRELRALAFRAHTSRDSSEQVSDVQAVTDEARHAPEPAPAGTNAPRKSRSSRRIVAGVVIGLVGASACVGAYLLGRPGRLPSTGIASLDKVADRVARRVQQGAAASIALVKDVVAGPTATATAATPADGKDRVLTRRRSGPKKTQKRAEAREADVAPPAAPDVDETEDTGGLLSEDPGNTLDGHDPGAVYSHVHRDVIPPELSRAQMPRMLLEGMPQDRAGELELVVGPDGRVVSATLAPASGRSQDRMMVSAAKTWRFEPARREGQPVPYRLRMPITW